LPGSTSLLHKLAMQSQTPYVDWTLSISILHSLMHWSTPTFLARTGGCSPQRLGTSTLQLTHAKSTLTLVFITPLISFTKDWNKQLLLQSLPPPASNPSPSVWMKTLRGYSPSTTAATTTTTAIALCMDMDEDVDCNTRNTSQTPMDTVPSIEGQAIQQSNIVHVCNLQQPTFNATIATSLGTNPGTAQSAIAMHLPQCCRRRHRGNPFNCRRHRRSA
jgi:hypothetical protein